MGEGQSTIAAEFGLPASESAAASVDVPAEPVFAPERVDGIRRRVLALREHWVERQPGFYTLGVALYQDARDPAGELPDAAASNALLEASFGAELDDLRTFLACELEAPVDWAPGLPLPGFHVVDERALQPGRPAGDLHFDVQYVRGGFAEPVREVLSVTVPIEVPAAGASLEHWPVDLAEFDRLRRCGEVAGLAEVAERFAMRSVPYEPGRACVMRGLPLHRMGTTRAVEPGDHRITLQGHAVLLGGRWLAYW